MAPVDGAEAHEPSGGALGAVPTSTTFCSTYPNKQLDFRGAAKCKTIVTETTHQPEGYTTIFIVQKNTNEAQMHAHTRG